MANPNAEQNGLLDQDGSLEDKGRSKGRVVCWVLILLVAMAAIVLMVLFIPGRKGSIVPLPRLDPCTFNNGGCQHNCSSVNDTNVECSCFEGYSLANDDKSCDDIDECTTEAGDCEQICHNLVASFTCSCNEGYLNTCNDIDECSTEANDCGQICMNQEPFFNCSCYEGYLLNDDGKTCDDIDECTTEANDCEQICLNQEPFFNCSCFEGYLLNDDGKTCGDIDECTTETNNCEQICNNQEPFFNCSCIEGYLLNDDGKTCDDIDECSTDANDCEQICHNQQPYFNCSCDEGYLLNDDAKTCDDIDECMTDDGGCEQICKNTEASFNCLCETGFALNADGKTCTVKIFYSDSLSGIYSIVAGGDPQMLSQSDGAYGIDYDCTSGYLFWSSVEQNAIFRGKLEDGKITEEETIVETGVEIPTDVAVDWVNGNVYWADNEHELIASASLDGSSVTLDLLGDTERRDPLAVAVNPDAGFMYWGYEHRVDLATTEYGIERATLDGANSTILVDGLDALSGLKYDQYTDQLCWCDGVSTIECLDLATSEREVVTSEGRRPFDIAFTEDSIYWISTELNDIMELPRDDTSGQGQRFNIDAGNPRGITAGWRCDVDATQVAL
ncbi:matrilin-2-like isoform X2 [Ptychodera flava]|uniref:matrilin-2-like isoform X2 n=1 Tax=Ptychodera flava TaxID=63121 RepID=UPI00396AA718